MNIFAVADLHLSHARPKPMDIFGPHWTDHADRLARAWDEIVSEDDVVLCPGDLSWALKLEQAAPDLAWIGDRPGRKILCRGNHDYWWSSLAKVRRALPPGCTALQNDAADLGEVVVAGARCWNAPGSPEFEPEDEKVYRRELGRLKASLEAAASMANGRPILAAIHYPPFTPNGQATGFSELLEEYGVALCVYGHLHGAEAHATAVEGMVRGIDYRCVACDFTGFRPVHVYPGPAQVRKSRRKYAGSG